MGSLDNGPGAKVNQRVICWCCPSHVDVVRVLPIDHIKDIPGRLARSFERAREQIFALCIMAAIQGMCALWFTSSI